MGLVGLAFVAVALVAGFATLIAPVLTQQIPTSRPLEATAIGASALLGAAFVARHPDAWSRHRILMLGLVAIAAGALVRSLASAAVGSAFAAATAGETTMVWGVLAASWLGGLLAAAGLAAVASGIAVARPPRRWPPLAVIVVLAGTLGILQGIASLLRIAAIGAGELATQSAFGGGVVAVAGVVAWMGLGVVAARRATLGGGEQITALLVVAAGLAGASAIWVIPVLAFTGPPLREGVLVLQAAFGVVSAGLLLVAFARGLPAHAATPAQAAAD